MIYSVVPNRREGVYYSVKSIKSIKSIKKTKLKQGSETVQIYDIEAGIKNRPVLFIHTPKLKHLVRVDRF